MQNIDENSDVYCLSDVGLKRSNNEDAAYAGKSPYGILLAVADGMGGHRKGEVASKIIIDSLSLPFVSFRRDFNVGKARHFIRKYLKAANKSIYEMSLSGNELKEMGSTAVCALISDNGTFISSVGDSRCYTYSEADGLIRRTTDQTYVELLFETGKITHDEIANHPQKNLLINAVGINPDLSQVQEVILAKDSYECILLCSDGLYNMVSDAEIASTMAKKISVCEKAHELINKALENGGKDNVAVSVWENNTK
ncbi:MAG: protein phosphatase 2C domain-containing protein [Bacilli bacterium]